MDYEEKLFDGVRMIAFKGCWYPLEEEVQDQFPFYDLTDRDLNALFGYGPSPQALYELFHDPPEDPLDYDDPDADDPYDLELAAY